MLTIVYDHIKSPHGGDQLDQLLITKPERHRRKHLTPLHMVTIEDHHKDHGAEVRQKMAKYGGTMCQIITQGII